jgi:hypothetical protein
MPSFKPEPRERSCHAECVCSVPFGQPSKRHAQIGVLRIESVEPYILARCFAVGCRGFGKPQEIGCVAITDFFRLAALRKTFPGKLANRFEQREARLSVRVLRADDEAIADQGREQVEIGGGVAALRGSRLRLRGSRFA